MQAFDLIGIGFGPSNIALAIAIDERCGELPGVKSHFIEKQASFAWHRNMMLDHAHMQISFLKDLVTLRNPRSRYTFINYLHEQGRLPDFINLKSFFPSRREFNDYLAWAAAQFDDRCSYGEEVCEVAPVMQRGRVELLSVRSRNQTGDIRERLTRNVVLGLGGSPYIPDCFSSLAGDPRVFHSSTYLQAISGLSATGRIAVIGAGQSAAEIFMDLHGRPERPHVDLIARGRSIRPSDDSPFVNEVFNAEFTDYVFSRPEHERSSLMREFWHTNYAAPDLELIQQMFKVLYEQRVSRETRHRYLRLHEVVAASAEPNGIRLTLRDMDLSTTITQHYDAVVLATGYLRNDYQRILAPLSKHVNGFEVDRQYRLIASPDFTPGIFLQGACEASHGLSDTLLSVTAIRTMEIARALVGAPAAEMDLRYRVAADLRI
jgi:L-ornithine N5-oxygenase